MQVRIMRDVFGFPSEEVDGKLVFLVTRERIEEIDRGDDDADGGRGVPAPLPTSPVQSAAAAAKATEETVSTGGRGVPSDAAMGGGTSTELSANSSVSDSEEFGGIDLNPSYLEDSD